MRLRTAFLSPPAVAGLALLAIVIGVAFAVRLGGSGAPDRTDVAGTVIERPEPTEEPEEADEPADVDDDPIVVPLEEEPLTDDPEDDPAPPAEDPPPADDPPPPVGLIPDPDPDPDPAPAGGDTSPTTDPDDSDSEPDETEPPSPRPPPETEEPEPSPTPADVALRTGQGHSRHTALAEGDDWLIREVSGHGQPEPDTSRQAAARLTVGFNDSARSGSGSVRSFSCQAWLTAGDERLTTDRDHVFEISLVALDDNGAVSEVVTSVIERQAFDLAPGEDTLDRLMATAAVELDAADDTDYSCVAVYRER